jgi:hypothetical protein
MKQWALLSIGDETQNCQVPTHCVGNPQLGRWVHTQRHMRRLKDRGGKSGMTQGRIDLLDQLGFSWEVKPDPARPRVSWQVRFEELKDHYQKYGHFVVDPTSQPELYKWCCEQRMQLKGFDKPVPPGKNARKRMSVERAKALNDIGFSKETRISETESPEGRGRGILTMEG